MQRGDLAVALRSLDQLVKVIDELGTLPRKLAVEAAPKITKLLKRQFSEGVDPYGRKWKRLASGKPSHLTESRRLRRAARAAPMLGGRMGLRFVFGARASIAFFHQYGTRNMPARRILPQYGMPREWRAVLDAESRKIAQRAARGLR